MTPGSRATFRLGAALATVAFAIAAIAASSTRIGAQEAQKRVAAEVHVLHVQGRVYMLVGAGSNITVQVGDEAVFLVDAGAAQMSDQVLAAVRSLSQKPIEYIFDTSMDEDHVGGNANLSKAGSLSTGLPGEEVGASVVAHLNVLNRMSAPTGEVAPVPVALWPTDTYDNDRWELFNDEAVILDHPHAAHTDGDSIVFFRRSDVISAGDIFNPEHYPIIEMEKGGTINGEIDALNRIIDIMVPKDGEEGGTYVIPGHGRLCDRAEIANYRDMVTIVRDRIADLVEKGKTLEQVKAARPTLDYDGIYGAASGPWANEKFIEAVYTDLSKQRDARGKEGKGNE